MGSCNATAPATPTTSPPKVCRWRCCSCSSTNASAVRWPTAGSTISRIPNIARKANWKSPIQPRIIKGTFAEQMWHTDRVRTAMLPRLLHLHPATCRRLTRLSKEAERDGAYRVAKRLQAVVLNAEGRTSGELAAVLKAPRSKISEWLAQYQAHGIEGLLEGCRSGRPPELAQEQLQQLGDILDRCASCFTRSTSQCSGHGGYWRGPTPSSRTDGIDAPIRRLKKSPLARLGLDLYGRSQLPAGLDLACDLKPGGSSAGGPGHRRTQKCEDSGCYRTLAHSIPLSGGHGLQRLDLPGVFGTVGAIIPPARRHSHPGQRLLSQGFGGLGLVPLQPPLAGGAPTAALLAGV